MGAFEPLDMASEPKPGSVNFLLNVARATAAPASTTAEALAYGQSEASSKAEAAFAYTTPLLHASTKTEAVAYGDPAAVGMYYVPTMGAGGYAGAHPNAFGGYAHAVYAPPIPGAHPPVHAYQPPPTMHSPPQAPVHTTGYAPPPYTLGGARGSSPVDDILLAADILSGALPSTASSFASGRSVPSVPSLPSPPIRLGISKRPPRRRARVACDVCGRQFGEAAAVRKHKRVVHDKVKEFGCDHCGRRFAEKSNLKKHIIARHEVSRTHKCTICSKDFNFTDGLRRHINNCHLGLRPYQCDDCPSAFKQRTHLQKHRASVHAAGKGGRRVVA